MGKDSTSGEAYRLILAIDQRVIIAGDRSYARFEEAQSKVADAVCHYGLLGEISAVALQQGRPSKAMNGATPPPDQRKPQDYVWTIEKRWGRDVVQRILDQNQIDAPKSPAFPRRNGFHAKPSLQSPKIPVKTIERKRHKYTRRHAVATAAIIALAMVALLFMQTGVNPARLLTSLSNPCETVKNDLPFDARTSFSSKLTEENTAASDHQ